ncbi:phytanoyl-CoA dioxygenase family protein [Sphingomonas canadensis]|uniref:Phytanoyl-CoA dioxygenase family protein n=1 Tax=Sphingomonas canadensis TaxID=1219257 RepID=A0ABW3H7K3_9SPHN|nr:phytanoyl-CoA dioxygenase family protein [Sphingomonas canadensis]MCW3834678.1 phytanoyl-CoA dioxygenase family protein [Sphingomonas canadensis]
MTEDDIARARAAYLRDGATVLRGVLDAEWIDRMRDAIERVIAAPSESAVEYTPQGQSGRYVGDFFVWMRDPDFADFVLRSPLPALARAMMGSQVSRLFYDQLLVKEPGTREHTPWHQDLPYWPVRGEQVLSLWIPFDPVTIATGAVQYARGSHLEKKLYAPRAFSADSGFGALYAKMGLEPAPDEAALRKRYEIVCWETEPGDVLVHHPLTFHFSAGNLSPVVRRRALAVRYLGDDARWDARPGTFVEKDTIRNGLIEPMAFADGDVPESANFPVC